MKVHLNHVVGAPSEQFCCGVFLKNFNEFINASGNQDWHDISLHFVNNWSEFSTQRELQFPGFPAHLDERHAASDRHDANHHEIRQPGEVFARGQKVDVWSTKARQGNQSPKNRIANVMLRQGYDHFRRRKGENR